MGVGEHWRAWLDIRMGSWCHAVYSSTIETGMSLRHRHCLCIVEHFDTDLSEFFVVVGNTGMGEFLKNLHDCYDKIMNATKILIVHSRLRFFIYST